MRVCSCGGLQGDAGAHVQGELGGEGRDEPAQSVRGHPAAGQYAVHISVHSAQVYKFIVIENFLK